MDQITYLLQIILNSIVNGVEYLLTHPEATAFGGFVLYVFIKALTWTKGKGLSDYLRLLARAVGTFILTWVVFSLINYTIGFMFNRAEQARNSFSIVEEEMQEFEEGGSFATPLPTIPPPVAPASGDTDATNGVRVESESEAAPAATPEAPEQGTQHEVVLGESLAIIAARYGVSIDAIAQLNGISNPNRISVGQLLLIPPPPGE